MAKIKSKQVNNVEKEQENLPVIAGPRLPYHPAIEERFGIDRSGWKALVEAIFPNAQSTESVVLALSYCKARKLDPFKRCIHIVPIWDKQRRCYIDTIWPGIGEVRTTAHRTKDYAGRDKTEFGPMQTQTWEGVDEKRGAYKTTVTFPEWAQVTVYRMLKGQRVAYTGPQVFWLETYGEDRNGVPNSMWQKRPRGQIDKCAEASSLRSAFPEEVGNEYIDAEAHLSRHVESREIEADTKSGVSALKERLAEREKAQNGGNGNGETEPEPEPETTEVENEGRDDPEPVDPELQDPETEKKAAEQKQKLQAAGTTKTNLF